MSCVFCGGSPVTREHVFPQWLNQYLPPGRQQIEQSRYGVGAYDVTRESVGLDFTVKKVCAPCNNGWMSKLEKSSKVVFEPLIIRQDLTFISLRQQRQIALWATKTAMMADQVQQETLLPSHQLRRMRTHRAIPGGTRVWLGSCPERNPTVTCHTVRMDLTVESTPDTPQPVGFYCPMKIGHLCIYVYFPAVDVVIQHAPEFHLSVARIWPRRSSDLPFPPPGQPRNGEEFEAFADALRESLYLYTPEQAAEHGLKES
ncbi:hypothetical protein OG896_23895 [Streptomyces sp. NBC_00669]|uniref:hypothetical protein n=1 Tax=Streptomyces sp. NBC_00669 TaxID=2976011 RepID=UPI002E319FFD|nr:hypothetical protein [Streptomyces sp. NBC_00669]